MAEESSVRSEIEDLEKLARNTEVIRIDLNNPEDKHLLEEYLKTHAKPGNSVSTVSFNKFLAEKKGFKGNKVVVAEITGKSIGFNEDDRYSGINVDGANFTGCRFKDIELHAMENVSLRDSVCDKVTILGGRFANVDMRGAEIDNCTFFNDAAPHALDDIQLAFANPNIVQDKGVFAIEDSASVGISIANIDAKIEKEKTEQIKAYLERQNTKTAQGQGFVARGFGIGKINTALWGNGLKKSDLTIKQQEHVSAIEARYTKLREAEVSQARRKHFIRFGNPICDPTYTHNQSSERASAVKISFEATKKDLEDYLKTNKKISFNDFIAEKYSEEFSRAKEANQGKLLVPVADLSGVDISGMRLSGDLSGVNFSYCKMNGCKFNGTKLNGSCFEGCEIKGAQFVEAQLMDCNMIGVKADEKTSFEKANMIRVRLNASDLKGVNLDGAVGYLANFRDSDMEGASMVRANMERSNLMGVNLSYVDAQYANMRRANLSGAVADHAKFMHANLTDTIAHNFRAQEANLDHAVMEGMQAHFIDLRKSSLERVQATKVDFSHADLREIQAAHADFEGAILRRADAEFAQFEHAILRDVEAQEANFRRAVLEDVKAERIDVSGAILDEANLKAANLKEAILQDISARKADFRKAFLDKAKLQRGAFVAADFRGAKMRAVQAQGAVFMAADLEGADVSKMQTDPTTILIDANLRGLIGDEETVNALRIQQKEQESLKSQWFGRSKYGYCAKNEDGSNDRFKCQRLGAMVLSGAIAGGAGVTLAGPLAGIPAATLAALISDKALVATKDHYFDELGYVNNALGDRLAEVGAIALSMGVGAADKAIDGAVAGLVCSFAGIVNGATLSAVGVGTTLGGLNLAIEGVQQKSRWKRIAGQVLGGVGAVTAFFGFSSLGTSLNTIAFTASIGGIIGGLLAAESSAIRLYEYDEGNGKQVAGARPEQIYNETINKAKSIWQKIVPTKRKLLIGAALAIGAAAIATVIVTNLPLLGAVGIAKLVVTANVAMTAGAAGFFAGYLYDNKIAEFSARINPFKKATKPARLEPSQEPQISLPHAVEQSTQREKFAERHPSKSKNKFSDQHKKRPKSFVAGEEEREVQERLHDKSE